MSTPLVGLTAILDAYQSILYGTSVLLIGLLIWAWFAYDYSNISREKQDREIYKIPADVLVVVAGLLLTPVSGAGLAVSLTGVYSARYVFLTVVGVAISVGLAIHKFGVRRRHSEVVAVGVVALAGMLHIYQSKIGLFERSAIAERTGLFAILGCSKAMEDSEEPIIVSDIHSFYILRHYGPATLTKRLVYLAEYNALASRMSQAMRRWNNWKVMEYKEFLSNNSRFLIYESEYTSSQAHSPLLGRLIVDGAWVTDSGCTDIRDIYPRPGSLYRVELPINRTSGISASKVR